MHLYKKKYVLTAGKGFRFAWTLNAKKKKKYVQTCEVDVKVLAERRNVYMFCT